MLPIIVAILVALSVVGGGVVYASENAPPSSPLHSVQQVVHSTASTLHLADPPTLAALSPDATGNSNTSQPVDQDDAHPRPTRTPIPTALATAFATAEADVHALATDTAVPGHSENGLDAKLDAAQNALSHGNTEAAAAILDAFARQLNAMERSGHISAADYTALRAQYIALLTQLNQTYHLTVTPIPTVAPNAHGPNSHAQPNLQNGKHDDDDAVSAGVTTGQNGTPTPTPTPEMHGKGNGANSGRDHH